MFTNRKRIRRLIVYHNVVPMKRERHGADCDIRVHRVQWLSTGNADGSAAINQRVESDVSGGWNKRGSERTPRRQCAWVFREISDLCSCAVAGVVIERKGSSRHVLA